MVQYQVYTNIAQILACLQGALYIGHDSGYILVKGGFESICFVGVVNVEGSEAGKQGGVLRANKERDLKVLYLSGVFLFLNYAALLAQSLHVVTQNE